MNTLVTFLSILIILLNFSGGTTFTCFVWFVIGVILSLHFVGKLIIHTIRFIDDNNCWSGVYIYFKILGIFKSQPQNNAGVGENIIRVLMNNYIVRNRENLEEEGAEMPEAEIPLAPKANIALGTQSDVLRPFPKEDVPACP